MTQLDGIVTRIDPLYSAPPETNWGMRTVLGVVMLPLVLAFILTILFVRLVFGLLSPGRAAHSHHGGLIRDALGRAMGTTLAGHLLGTTAQVPVRDMRVRDASGLDHLVRIHGHLRRGSVAVGDTVIIQGSSKQGTLILKSGYNHNTRSEIRVK